MAARWLLCLLTGCSLTLSGPDPNRPRNKMPSCDTSKALVALDGVIAAALGTTALAVASSNDGSAAVVPALLAALYVGSAIHGNSVVESCHREMESYDQVMAGQQMLPPGQQGPQPAPMPQGYAQQSAAQQFAPRPSVAPPPMPRPTTSAVAAEPAADEPDPPAPPEQPAPPVQAQPAPPPVQHARWSAFWREVP